MTFKLGSRAGNGNHKVRARAVGFEGEVVFYASATYGDGIQMGIIDGNNQRGSVRQPLPKPLVLAVTDVGANLIPNAQIEFKVIKGGGKFNNGETTYLTTTDTDGRASASFILGPEEGLDVQRVTATLVGTSTTADFTASGFVPGDPGQTSIFGVVLDNQDQPMPGVTIRVDGSSRQAVTDEQGQFTLTEAPVGPVHLLVEGSTTTRPGEWPSFSYNIVTVPGVKNPLVSPIYLVEIDTENAVFVGEEDTIVTHPETPGFKLEVPAGSVTFPDGSKTGYLSITRVNANKIPMAPPSGMQPQLIVTIQPHGALFDPPAKLTIPNTDGHAPGARVEMYSYDHDLEEFVTIGLGTVSVDGATITSNEGSGVIKAGWHGGSQPGGSGCCSGPDECDKACTEPAADCSAGCKAIPDCEPCDGQNGNPPQVSCDADLCFFQTADHCGCERDPTCECEPPDGFNAQCQTWDANACMASNKGPDDNAPGGKCTYSWVNDGSSCGWEKDDPTCDCENDPAGESSLGICQKYSADKCEVEYRIGSCTLGPTFCNTTGSCTGSSTSCVGSVPKNDGQIIPDSSGCFMCADGNAVPTGNCGSNASIKLVDRRSNKEIKNGDTILIGPEPVMPLLEASIDGGDAIVNWSFTSSHARRPRGLIDGYYRYCADADVDDKQFSETLSQGDKWDIYRSFDLNLSANFFGAADINNPDSYFARIEASGASPISFNIHGENPQQSKVKSYIEKLNTPHDYIWQIALHESVTKARRGLGTVFQFNRRTASTPYPHTPNFGVPDGWGIMQIDYSAECNKSSGVNSSPVPTNLLWNWKDNLQQGVIIASTKRNRALQAFRGIVRYIKHHYPDEYINPPSDIVALSKNRNTLNLQNVDHVGICAVQGYNGLSRVTPQCIRTVDGNDDCSSDSVRNERRYCLMFLRDVDINGNYTGKPGRWTFNRNVNGYVYEVFK